MNILKPFAFGLLLICYLVPARTISASPLSEKLQNSLLRYAVTIGEDVRVIKRDNAKIIENLAQWRIDSCELDSELQMRRPTDNRQVRHVLNDLLDRQKREYGEALRDLEKRLSAESAEHKRELQKLAFQLAVQSVSLSEIRDELIPNLFNQLSGKLDRIKDLDIKVALILGELARLGPICDRLSATQEQVANNSVRIDQLEANQANGDFGPSVLAHGQVQLVPFVDGSGSGRQIRQVAGWQTINGTPWEPEAYSDSVKLCANPTPGPRNVTFDTNLVENGQWIPIRHYGDMYQNCSGEIVMVRKKTVFIGQ